MQENTALTRLIECQHVHYVAYNGKCLAGLVIGFDATTKVADLVIFTNMANVNGVKNFGMQFQQDIAYCGDEVPKPGTYHFLEHE